MHSELDEGQTMVSPLQLASMLVDWMDPDKAVYVESSLLLWAPVQSFNREVPGRKKDDSVHIDLAADIIKALFDDKLSRA